MFQIVIRNGQILLVARQQKVIKGQKTTITIPQYKQVEGDVPMASYRSLKRAASEYLDAVINKTEVLKWAALQS